MPYQFKHYTQYKSKEKRLESIHEEILIRRWDIQKKETELAYAKKALDAWEHIKMWETYPGEMPRLNADEKELHTINKIKK